METRKIVGCIFLGLFALIALFQISGMIFMSIYHLPLELCRPWTIFQYFSMYSHSASRGLRIAVNLCTAAPFLLAIGVVILIFANKNKRALHGEARFATLEEIKKAGLIDPPEGLEKTILVGKYKNHYLTYAGYQFVLLAAPTRSGKGVGVVIPNCLNFSDSLVVLDIKGENYEITSGYRQHCGQEVYLFSPYDEEGKTFRYNPLAYVRSNMSDRIGDIDAIAQALFSGGNKTDQFWQENAKDLFRGLCLLVLETPELPKTFGEILRQASGKGKPLAEYLKGKLQEAQEKGHPYSSKCVESLSRILGNSENTLAGIVATFNTALLCFVNPRVDLATSGNDFDLRDVRKKRMSIYFKIEPTKLNDAKVLINLFFDQLLNLNTRKLPSQDKSLKYQCLVLLDEMTSIGSVNMIKQAVSYMAGYNMRLLTIIQNKSQLKDVYGEAGATTLLSNHALMIMYAPSPTVQSDANEYSEMLGYQTVKSTSKSTSKGGSSSSESDQRRALMLPQEIKELGKNNEIVSLENTKPIFCQKIKYYEDPAFRVRAFGDRLDGKYAPSAVPQLDINRFICETEQRIRTMSSDELDNPDAASKIVTSDTSLPSNLSELPDKDWTVEDISNYVENMVSGAVNASTNIGLSQLNNIRTNLRKGTTEENTEEGLGKFQQFAKENAGNSEPTSDALEEAQKVIEEGNETSEDAGAQNTESDADDDLMKMAALIEEETSEKEAASEDTEEVVEINAEVTQKTTLDEDGRSKEINASIDVTVDNWSREEVGSFVENLIRKLNEQALGKEEIVEFSEKKEEIEQSIEKPDPSLEQPVDEMPEVQAQTENPDETSETKTEEQPEELIEEEKSEEILPEENPQPQTPEKKTVISNQKAKEITKIKKLFRKGKFSRKPLSAN